MGKTEITVESIFLELTEKRQVSMGPIGILRLNKNDEIFLDIPCMIDKPEILSREQVIEKINRYMEYLKNPRLASQVKQNDKKTKLPEKLITKKVVSKKKYYNLSGYFDPVELGFDYISEAYFKGPYRLWRGRGNSWILAQNMGDYETAGERQKSLFNGEISNMEAGIKILQSFGIIDN